MRLCGKDDVYLRINKTIAPGDGMWREKQPDDYFFVGASAMVAIDEALAAARLDKARVRRVLDYACGFGRVLRWLRVEFPKAYLLGVDAQKRCVKAAAQTLGVPAQLLDTSLKTPFDRPFDLIWVGSLFTHLPQDECERVLAFLRSQLNPDGLLVFTTAGFQVRRIFSEDQKPIVDQFDATGFGYVDRFSVGYGTTLASPANVTAMAQVAGLEPVFFKARGWADRQDVYGARVLAKSQAGSRA